MMTYKFLRGMFSTRLMDERLTASRRSEFHELIENMTYLNALEEKFWKKRKVGKSGKSNLNIVMNEHILKNIVTNANLDPKVAMDPSMFKNGGWHHLQPSNRNLLEELVDENEPWLLFGIPNRDALFVTQYLERHSASSDQHMKKLMSLREGVMTQCYMRQHFADRYWPHEHPGGRASWREPTMTRMKRGC